MKNAGIVLLLVIVGVVSGFGGFYYGRVSAYSNLVKAGIGVFDGDKFKIPDHIKKIIDERRAAVNLIDKIKERRKDCACCKCEACACEDCDCCKCDVCTCDESSCCACNCCEACTCAVDPTNCLCGCEDCKCCASDATVMPDGNVVQSE